MKRSVPIFFLTVLFAAAYGFCVNVNVDSLLKSRNIVISGSVAIVEGQLVKGHHLTSRLDTNLSPSTALHYEPFPYPMWLHNAHASMQFDIRVSERLRVIVSPEMVMWYETYPREDITINKGTYAHRERASVFIVQGQGIYSFGALEKPFLKVAAGLFPYKYNPEASNLGEYLFRSGCYPPYIITEFDYTAPRLSGLRVGSDLFGFLHQDLLLTTETQVQPMFDWSLSYLANAKIGTVLDIGAGVSFNRLFPVSGTIESQKWSENMYLTSTGEKKYYSFSGTKLMGRITFDPKGLLSPGLTSLFGKEDLKLFAETAVLGVRNSPDTVYKYRDALNADSTIVVDTNNYYGKRSQRMPVMFGINLPAFKLLDVVSVQGEWYGWPYVDAFYYQTMSGENAVPPPSYFTYLKSDYENDSWKWSVQIKKTVLRHFTITGQAARDHSHHLFYWQKFNDDNEVFTRSNEWGWWLKLQYHF